MNKLCYEPVSSLGGIPYQSNPIAYDLGYSYNFKAIYIEKKDTTSQFQDLIGNWKKAHVIDLTVYVFTEYKLCYDRK